MKHPKDHRLTSRLYIKQEKPVESPLLEEGTPPNLFGMNRIPRLGRSKDEDGKSNIWSVEPKMEVKEDPYELTDANTNVMVGGLLFTSIAISLPLLYLFSQFFPDPSNY